MLEALGFIACERGGLGHQSSVYRFIDDWAFIRTPAEAKERLKAFKAELAEEERRSKLARDKLSELENEP